MKRTDMHTHIKNRHDRNIQRVEDILMKCQVLKQENKIIDPGAFEFLSARRLEWRVLGRPTMWTARGPCRRNGGLPPFYDRTAALR
jgi:hypothetical protein